MAVKKGEKLESGEFISSSLLVSKVADLISDIRPTLPGDLKAQRLWQKPHRLLQPRSPPEKQPAREHGGDRSGQIRDEVNTKSEPNLTENTGGLSLESGRLCFTTCFVASLKV